MNKFFFEIHSQLDREGPGSFADTKRAWECLPAGMQKPSILDLACGPGAQTIDLSKLTEGVITAIDLHEPFVKNLEDSIRKLNLAGRIKPMVQNMKSLNFAPESFDVIWCEGALYFMGIECGLKTLKPLLKANGFLSFTEPVWLKSNPPLEVVRNWSEYPLMKNVEDNIDLISDCGFKILKHFTLSPQAWESYYAPLEARALSLRSQYRGDSEKVSLLDETLNEISIYRRFPDYFGYEFFITQKK